MNQIAFRNERLGYRTRLGTWRGIAERILTFRREWVFSTAALLCSIRAMMKRGPTLPGNVKVRAVFA